MISKDQKIAIIYRCIPTSGGGFQYEKSIREIIFRVCESQNIQVLECPLVDTWSEYKSFSKISGVQPYRLSLFEKILSRARKTFVLGIILNFFNLSSPKLERQLINRGIDLAIFVSQNQLSAEFITVPIATTFWDLGHRDLPAIPEFSGNGAWAFREEITRKSLGRSFHVFVDSDSTKRKIEQIYDVSPKSISTLGLLPSNREPSGEQQFSFGDQYFLYPAQMWPHKNHVTLLQGFRMLLRDFPEVKLVFTGSDKGNGTFVLEYARDLELTESVINLGFVSDIEMTELIQSAKAVVMPSLLGPTNLPPLEALGLGTHAIISDVHEFPFEIQEMMTTVPALDASKWAEAMAEILEKPPLNPLKFSTSEQEQIIENVFKLFFSQRNLWPK